MSPFLKVLLKRPASVDVVGSITFPVAVDYPNKQMRNETSRGVSQQVRLGTILRVGKTRKPRKTKGDG